MSAWVNILVVALMLLGIVAATVTHMRSERRRSAGLCEKCGYDLRASDKRCPECGERFYKLGEWRGELDPAKLELDWPTEEMKPRVPRADEEPVDVFRTRVPLEAVLLQEHFESRGMVCRAEAAADAPGHRIVVWSDDVERAIAVIDSLRRTEETSAVSLQTSTSSVES
jgi:hypothetical protein